MSKHNKRQDGRVNVIKLKQLFERANTWFRRTEPYDTAESEFLDEVFRVVGKVVNLTAPGQAISIPISTTFEVDEKGLIKTHLSPAIELLEGIEVNRIRLCCRPRCGRLFYVHRLGAKACSYPCANYCRVKRARDKAKDKEYKRQQRRAAKELRQGAERKKKARKQ